MIADDVLMPMTMHSNVKVYENKKPRIPVIPPKKRIGYPRIKVGIIRRWRVICHNRCAFSIVIIVYDFRLRGTCGGRFAH
jgi:hypothetical protein